MEDGPYNVEQIRAQSNQLIDGRFRSPHGPDCNGCAADRNFLKARSSASKETSGK